MNINHAGRRRKRLVLGVLAAGVVGVTAIGGAMAASAEERHVVTHRGQERTSVADAEADIPGLEDLCRNNGGEPIVKGTSGDFTVPEFWADVDCSYPSDPSNPNDHLDFFPSF